MMIRHTARFFVLSVLSAVLGLAPAAFAKAPAPKAAPKVATKAVGLTDSPSNLKIYWARTARDNVAVYADTSTSAKVLKKFKNMDLLDIARCTDVKGVSWCEVASPTPGWVPERDLWYSTAPDQRPDTLSLAERLTLRLNIAVGSYPKLMNQKLGKPISASFRKGDGVAIQTFRWPGLLIVHENSSMKQEYGWISQLTVVPGKVGSQVYVGPIRVGDSAMKLKLLDPDFDPKTQKELKIEHHPSYFHFLTDNGLVSEIRYYWGLDGYLPYHGK